jgi:3-deoxy-D-manno-octulosonic-acid transferase
MWPHLLIECESAKIPVRLVNARMSPRSRRRYERFRDWIRPIYSKLNAVAVQEKADAEIWETLGVERGRISVVGSLKFDTQIGRMPAKRQEFSEMLEACAGEKSVVLAASTHVGEEVIIGRAVRAVGGFFLCVPRHAERRAEVRAALELEGFEVILRSDFHPPRTPDACCLVVDTTGELSDWTAHADGVVIGKSFLGVGGQNPAEAILASKPLIFGPHMENFQPLASTLVKTGGACRVEGEAELAAALKRHVVRADEGMARAASQLLARHEGAMGRTLELLI